MGRDLSDMAHDLRSPRREHFVFVGEEIVHGPRNDFVADFRLLGIDRLCQLNPNCGTG